MSPTFPLPFLILSLYFLHLSQHVLPPLPSLPLFQHHASLHSCMTYLILFLTPLGHLQSSLQSARRGEGFDILKRQQIQGSEVYPYHSSKMEWTPWRRLNSSNKSHHLLEQARVINLLNWGKLKWPGNRYRKSNLPPTQRVSASVPANPPLCLRGANPAPNVFEVFLRAEELLQAHPCCVPAPRLTALCCFLSLLLQAPEPGAHSNTHKGISISLLPWVSLLWKILNKLVGKYFPPDKCKTY